jgi:hypothetical protein
MQHKEGCAFIEWIENINFVYKETRFDVMRIKEHDSRGAIMHISCNPRFALYQHAQKDISVEVYGEL